MSTKSAEAMLKDLTTMWEHCAEQALHGAGLAGEKFAQEEMARGRALLHRTACKVFGVPEPDDPSGEAKDEEALAQLHGTLKAEFPGCDLDVRALEGSREQKRMRILETIESHLLADCEVKTGVLTALVEPSTAIVVPEAPDAAARLQCLQENVQNVADTGVWLAKTVPVQQRRMEDNIAVIHKVFGL